MTTGTYRAINSVQIVGTLLPSAIASSVSTNAAKFNQNETNQFTLSYGTGSGQSDSFVYMYRTLAGGANETLDLYDGSTPTPDIVDVFGDVIAFRKIKLFRIEMVANSDGTTASTGCVIGNAATNVQTLWFGGTTPTQSLVSGGVPFCQGDAAGKTVDATNRNVKITNSDATNKLTYLLTMAGTTA